MNIQRRELIMGFAGAAAAGTMAAQAQERRMTVVGYLSAGAAGPRENFLVAFREGLRQMGFIEGRNVAIEYRFANRVLDQLPDLARDLIRRPVNVIMASTRDAARAARDATADIPIVFRTGGNVGPGGNVTGVNDYGFNLWPERLGLLHDLLPRAKNITVMLGQQNENDNVTAAAQMFGLTAEIKTPESEQDIDFAFYDSAQKDAVVVSQNLFFEDRHVHMARLAAYYGLPAIFAERSFCEVGGLASYGSDYVDQERLAGIWVGRILNGEKPAVIRVLRPTKSEFVINRQTARSLGLRIPRSLLALADTVIE
jgi:putative ABC transport system substrate-binding protein